MRSDWSGRTPVVVGASRGLGRGIAPRSPRLVLRWSRSPGPARLATTSANIRSEVADAADATVAWSLLAQYELEVLILTPKGRDENGPEWVQAWVRYHDRYED